MVTINDIKNAKRKGEKLTALTAYDFLSAFWVDKCGIDIVLVGDSLGMVIKGDENTLSVTLEEIIYHSKIVRKSVKNGFLVVDLPFGSFHITPEDTLKNCIRIIKETGANGVKIEGGKKRFELIKKIVDSEIPVMGHIGLTPQSINVFGGYKVQGKNIKRAEELIEDAIYLEKAGCFSIVLELVPKEISKIITEKVKIPTIGIGSGPYCDGQVLVFHDMLGMNPLADFKFLRKYANLSDEIENGITNYINDVKKGSYPSENESFTVGEKLKNYLEEKYGSYTKDK